jgi:hypothetical protein
MTAAGTIPGEADLAGARPLLAVPAPRVGANPMNAPGFAEPGSGDDELPASVPAAGRVRRERTG